MIIDSHCHLDHEPLFNNLENIIKRSKDVGIEKLLTICTTHKSFENILKIIKKDNIIFGTFGISMANVFFTAKEANKMATSE